MNPDRDRSIRYHRDGFARASVKESCRVEVQGSRRMANMIPMKAPTLLTSSGQSVVVVVVVVVVVLSASPVSGIADRGEGPAPKYVSNLGSSKPSTRAEVPQKGRESADAGADADADADCCGWVRGCEGRCVTSTPNPTPSVNSTAERRMTDEVES